MKYINETQYKIDAYLNDTFITPFYTDYCYTEKEAIETEKLIAKDYPRSVIVIQKV